MRSTVRSVGASLDDVRSQALGLPYPGRAWLADWLLKQAESDTWVCDDVELELIIRTGPVASGWDGRSAADILREAEPTRDRVLAMPEDEREGLIRELVASVGPDTDDGRRAAAEWIAEIQDRIESVRSGTTASVAWEEVERRLHATYPKADDDGATKAE